MVPLLLLSVAVVAIAFDRARFWRELGSAGSRRWQRLEQDLLAGALPPLASLQAPAADLLRRLTAAQGEAARQLELQLCLQLESQRMARGERILEASAALGPLLGLLGTVTGLMRTFASLGGPSATASADVVALGISEVLVATAMGILLALLAVVVLRINTAFRSSHLALLERLALAFELNHQQLISSHG